MQTFIMKVTFEHCGKVDVEEATVIQPTLRKANRKIERIVRKKHGNGIRIIDIAHKCVT